MRETNVKRCEIRSTATETAFLKLIIFRGFSLGPSKAIDRAIDRAGHLRST